MLRTYKSKKETGGGLDHREMVFNLDEKSSAFDAFYIQNIKQTKREQSCVGSSNPYGVTGSRVRKRKYVKRIVKEVDPPPRLSPSTSVFLTPDKSIRVNKAPDLFDQLLNSSPPDSGPILSKKEDLFDKILLGTPKLTKTYRRKRSVKKVNYLKESSESDKENLYNDKQNETDIQSHKLVIEKEAISTNVDDSINNIVRKLSVQNNIKRKSNGTKTFTYNKNRLTMNIQSPLTKTSPLSSTPFTDKQRSQSIYNWSPIPMTNLEESPNYVSVVEDVQSNQCPSNVQNQSNKSIVFVSNSINVLTRSHNDKQPSPINCLSNNNSSKSLFSSNADTQDHLSTHKLPVEPCSLQTAEMEPFLGFEIDAIGKDAKPIEEETDDKNCSIIVSLVKTSKSFKSTDTSESSLKTENAHCEFKSNDDSNINKSIDDYTAPYLSLTDQALTKQANIEKSNSNISFSNTIDSEPFLGFSKVENAESSQDKYVLLDKTDSYTECSSNSSDDTTHEDNKQSLYDTCSSASGSSLNQKSRSKEPIVVIERINSSLFMKFYNNLKNYGSENEDTGSEENLSEDDSDDLASFVTGNDSDEMNDERSIHNAVQDITSVEEEFCREVNSFHDAVNSTQANISTDEDKCISYVTTRRRNDFTNNLTILGLDYSQDSISSGDCDKTVLSNNRDCLCSINPKKDININMDVEVNDNSILARSNNEVLLISPNTKQNINFNINVEVNNISTLDRSESGELNCINSEEKEVGFPKSEASVAAITKRKSEYPNGIESSNISMASELKPGIVLQPGKKWERSLSIYRRMTTMDDHFDHSLIDKENLLTKGRKYRQSVINTMEMQECQGSLHNESILSRRSTIVPNASRSTIRIVREPSTCRLSLSSTAVFEDLKGFLEDCDDTIIELSKLSIADDHDVTVLDKFHESSRNTSARDYVLRRCNQQDTLPFDECYPDPLLKNCRKIGEGVYGEVFLWRAPDGRARVMKIVPIAGDTKVNGEQQKDFHEIISEIVIAMELSALRAPIAQIECHFDEGKEEALDLHSVENATDVFNEVLAVRCVYGNYPSRLLDLWELYDETRGSENDSPAALPPHQRYLVLELANAGQDLESYTFASAEQAYALFLQVAFGLAVGEEAFQFEHRDLHWGNVLIAPTDQKYATFVLRGRPHRIRRRGVAATIIDYSLSRVTVPLASDRASLHHNPLSAALYNDLAADQSLFAAVGDYQFHVYRLMRDRLGNDWKNFEPYTNILWLHYTVDKMITALRYKRTNTKTHKQYIAKLKAIKERILNYGSAAQFVLTDNEY